MLDVERSSNSTAGWITNMEMHESSQHDIAVLKELKLWSFQNVSAGSL